VTPQRVGFIGLGAMGGRMAVRLLDAGHELAVHDPVDAAVAPLAARGARACRSAAEVADAAETVLVSLPTPDVVRQVARELAGGEAVKLYVDLSTTGPAAAEEIAAELTAANVACVDAPVSGGTKGAESGRLAIMAAGSPDAIERARPLLEILGANLFVVGDRPGQGQVAKVANNLLSGSAVAITAEALTLGMKAGLNPRTLLEVFNASSGQNTATLDKFPRAVLTGTYDVGFRLELMAKDIRLCLAEADRLGNPMLLGATVEQLWTLAELQTEPDADMMAMVQLVERWAGTAIEEPEPS
jgi:3-hydroxyisobutyrate dehydrogenase